MGGGTACTGRYKGVRAVRLESVVGGGISLFADFIQNVNRIQYRNNHILVKWLNKILIQCMSFGSSYWL